MKKLTTLLLFTVFCTVAGAQTLPERERELVRILENGRGALRGDSAAVSRLCEDWKSIGGEIPMEIPEKIPSAAFVETMWSGMNGVLFHRLHDALYADQKMEYPFAGLAAAGITVRRSADGRVRVFSWDDTLGESGVSRRNAIQYWVNDSVSRSYFSLSWRCDEVEEALAQMLTDTVMQLRGGIYLLHGTVEQSETEHGERLVALDIYSGVMRKAYPFQSAEGENRAWMAVDFQMPEVWDETPRFPLLALDGERLTVRSESLDGNYTDLYYNGAYFEPLEAKQARDSKGDPDKYTIVRLMFKDRYNTTVLDEVDPGEGISLVCEVAYPADKLYDLEDQTVKQSLACSFYKGSPTIVLDHLPLINGYCCVENLDIVGLCRTKQEERGNIFTRWNIFARRKPQRILEVMGPDEALPYQKVRYTAVRFQRELSKEDARRIYWAIAPPVAGQEGFIFPQQDAVLLDTALYHGTQIELAMLPEWLGGSVHVMPYIGSEFSLQASCVTDVVDLPESAFEGGLQRIGSEYATVTVLDDEEMERRRIEEEEAAVGEEPDEFEQWVIDDNLPWDAAIINLDDLGEEPEWMTERIMEQVKAYGASDCDQIFYNNVMRERFPGVSTWFSEAPGDPEQNIRFVSFDEDENPSILLVGKFLGDGQTFAISYYTDTNFINFMRLSQEEDTFLVIGQHTIEGEVPYTYLYFEDLDHDGRPEIVMSSSPNMNGNRWMEAFRYDAQSDRITHAGDFCTDYRTGCGNNIAWMTEEYGGSWYMDECKTFYVWAEGRLLPIAMSVLEVPSRRRSNKYYLSYYRNPMGVPGGMEKVFRKRYREGSELATKYWDGLFELQIPDNE